jgi:hypothetical protein
MAAYLLNHFPAAVRAMAACCKLPVALRLGLSQKDISRTKEKRALTKEKDKKEKQRKAVPPLLLSYGCHEGGRGEKQGFLDLGAQLFSLRSPLFFSFSPLPELPFRRLTLCSVLLCRGRDSPLNIRGGASYCLPGHSKIPSNLTRLQGQTLTIE